MSIPPDSFPRDGSEREAQVSDALIDLADTLADDFQLDHLPARVAGHCLDLLDIDDAGVMLTEPDGMLRLAAATSHDVRLIARIELEAGEGPCRTALLKAAAVDHTLSAVPTPPWPRFSARAHQAGYSSVHAIPIHLRNHTLGVLALFLRCAGRLPDSDRHLARALATATALAVLQHTALARHRTTAGQLQQALVTRTVIEQAKGFLAARHTTDPTNAFQWMRAHARHHHLRLADLAHDIVDGTFTLVPPGSGNHLGHR
ncbi:GAF and ANTAR domain-containing protein [Streptomyces chrestomyceticus]|uniref:GAF and ANTAR domain-containing protein n=1 Tax=Streptomyces chrestomyceticus TaxID=68185 RepID=UPI0019D1E136|nr:GAF and ANTAR domain-containing protein [Streptomyces chrestomyceticus]